MNKSEAGKGDKNTRVKDWKKYREAPIWKTLKKTEGSKDDKD